MRKQSVGFKILLLTVVMLISIMAFMTYHTYGNWEFALPLRGKKVLAFIIVGALTSFSTISFQTITRNQFLTPGILGFDSLYVLIQTLLFFFLGQSLTKTSLVFLLNVLLMVTFSVLLFGFILRREKKDLFLLLMIGMVLGTAFSSISTFLQVLMDPNEYDKLQGKLFASFSNVDVSLLFVVIPIVLVVIILFFRAAHVLDVFHLGTEQATSLGINVARFQKYILYLVSLSVALSTALIGPVTFLGFIVANVTYQWLGTYKHQWLFIGSTLISVFLLVFGQFLIEHVFHMSTTLSVVIEFGGGVYFIWKLLKERGKVT